MADSGTVTENALGPPLYAQLPPAIRQIGMLVAIAAAVAAGVALVLWSQGETFTPLYTGLADRDASEVVALIEAADVEYRLDPATGSVLVPVERKYDLRMQLATAGLPRGAGFGIDEIPEMTSLGQTPAMEAALYNRALETELGRTIAAVESVDFARVHLALPPQSAFVRRQREPTASVFVSLFPGRRLGQAQVDGIVNLVAAAVPELAPSGVTVTDADGTLLTVRDDETGAGLSTTQLQYARQREEELSRRIESLLAAVVGPESVRATVAAEFDFTIAEETRESYDPNVSLVRSESTSEESRSGDAPAQGVPGALTNQPPGTAPDAPDPAQVQANSPPTAPPTSTSREQTRNYELDKTISHVKQAVGTIERLSIGVLIDNRPGAGGATEPLPPEEVESLTELAKQAVGFDEARGDTITVHNAPFLTPPQFAAPEPLEIWQQPWVWSAARQVLGGVLVLVLAFFIVRPIMRSLTRPQPLIAAGDLSAIEGGGPGAMSALPRSYALPVGYDDRMAAARSVAGQDPRQVAQVVRNWVSQDEG